MVLIKMFDLVAQLVEHPDFIGRARVEIVLIKMFDLVAQLVEHNTFNVGAQGSNPCGITKALKRYQGLFLCLIHTFYFLRN